MKPQTPAGTEAAASSSEAEVQQRVQVAHQHDGRIEGRGGRECLEYPAQADAGCDGRVAGALDRDTVGHRVAEGHADFHHVAAPAMAFSVGMKRSFCG